MDFNLFLNKLLYLSILSMRMKKFKKILVANRGEIALRVIRSIKESGRIAIAVYSDVDVNAPHVLAADEAYCLGSPVPAESYLNIAKILQIAKKSAADAIHPGYGFLSENETFAKAVADAGITFIGPGIEAIRIMGDKIMSKKTVKGYHVPMLSGTEGAILNLDDGKKMADAIGYPVLIKASAGGGGKGMRIVHAPDDFKEQMDRAVSEATSAFGNGAVFIEKYITNPKHIEFQILSDSHGNTVHLFERECSIQRRYQKVIEEAPSAVLDNELRQRMGEAAVNVAKSCNYLGAGTVEFILDEQRNFFFLEMNTRLQVEHPVTEMISGIDLVKEQISIAEGNPLSFSQSDLSINGHSLEVRVYAEEPFENFLPVTGTFKKYRIPSGPGIRVDDGYSEGMEMPVYYDPMIAKLIVHGHDRSEAISRMLRAIDEYQIEGIPTSLPFCQFVLTHDEFIQGNFTTSFVEKNWKSERPVLQESDEKKAAFVAALIYDQLHKKKEVATTSDSQLNPWKINRRS